MLGDELFAWQVQELDGKWSLVGALLGADQGGTVHTPLIHRSREFIEEVRPLAERHSRVTGQPLRLARFSLAETLVGG